MKRINDIGMDALKTWIIATAKEDHCGIDSRNLEAWAQEAEDHCLSEEAYKELDIEAAMRFHDHKLNYKQTEDYQP